MQITWPCCNIASDVQPTIQATYAGRKMFRFRPCPMARTDPLSNLQFHDPDLFGTLSGVERESLEFKRKWHSRDLRVKHGPFWQVIQTVTAFANDYEGNGGGYLVIGIDEKKEWPSNIVHIEKKDLNRIVKEIKGGCRSEIKPTYVPTVYSHAVKVGEEKRNVLVIWAPKSNHRPHRCKETEKGMRQYYIRQGMETRKASSEEEIRRLMSFLDSKVPFDDAQSWACDSGKIFNL